MRSSAARSPLLAALCALLGFGRETQLRLGYSGLRKEHIPPLIALCAPRQALSTTRPEVLFVPAATYVPQSAPWVRYAPPSASALRIYKRRRVATLDAVPASHRGALILVLCCCCTDNPARVPSEINHMGRAGRWGRTFGDLLTAEELILTPLPPANFVFPL